MLRRFEEMNDGEYRRREQRGEPGRQAPEQDPKDQSAKKRLLEEWHHDRRERPLAQAGDRDFAAKAEGAELKEEDREEEQRNQRN